MMKIECSRCGSTRVIPVIPGSLDDTMLELHLLGLASAGGCFQLGVGSSVWECADCCAAIRDPDLLFNVDANSHVMRAYYAAVDDALAQHRKLSDDEHSALRGRGFLKGVCRRHFDAGATVVSFEPSGDGFIVHAGTNGQAICESHPALNHERWNQLRAFHRYLSAQSEFREAGDAPLLRLRLKGEDRYFALLEEEGNEFGKSLIVRPAAEIVTDRGRAMRSEPGLPKD